MDGYTLPQNVYLSINLYAVIRYATNVKAMKIFKYIGLTLADDGEMDANHRVGLHSEWNNLKIVCRVLI